jgi:hypothetical protein
MYLKIRIFRWQIEIGKKPLPPTGKFVGGEYTLGELNALFFKGEK